MDLVINILGIFNLLITIITFIFKEKKQILLCFLAYDILLITQYALIGRLTELIVCIIAAIKVITYFIFAIKKISPKLFVVLIFEALILLTGILTWQNWSSLVYMIAAMITTYASWQNSETILRVGYIIACSLYIINYLVIGTYMLILSEAVYIGSAVVGIILYDILKVQNKKANQTNQTVQNEQTNEEISVKDSKI